MKQYENLLSQDPIAALEKIKENYKRYFETAYRINNKELDKKRVDLLSKDDNLFKEPYLEILPEYTVDKNVDRISKLSEDSSCCQAFSYNGNEGKELAQSFFSFINKGLMGDNFAPYGHQVDMFKRTFIESNNAVITSGTGSGKTESFLLPLLAQIYKEAKTWDKPQYNLKWFDLDNFEPIQRKGERRPAALRAMIIYPMNALVNDQMQRLRRALDYDDVRDFFDSPEVLNGNRIFFGRYNGETTGSQSKEYWKKIGKEQYTKKRENIATDLNKIYKQFDNIRSCANSENDYSRKEELLCIAPRLSDKSFSGEMVDRWNMQITPPDIMITNTSMLSIMLMRHAEENIFEATKEWLKADSSHIFTLALDELHLYRGTTGSEVAFLVRLFLKMIGLPPVVEKNGQIVPNPQLRVLASSASLGNDDKTEQFLEEFFGVYHSDRKPVFYIQKGADYIPADNIPNVNFEDFKFIPSEYIDLSQEERREKIVQLIDKYRSKDIEDFLSRYSESIFSQLLSATHQYAEGKEMMPNNNRVISLSALQNQLFKGSKEALHGFLLFIGDPDVRRAADNTHKLPRIRFHQFFKYIEGLWGELQSNVFAKDEINENSINEISYTPQEVGKSGHKILELLRCEYCGEVYIGGNRKYIDNNGFSMSLNYPELEKVPNRNPTPMVQNKKYNDYAIFWATHQKNEKNPNDIYFFTDINGNKENFKAITSICRNEKTSKKFEGNWRRGYLDPITGKVSLVCQNKDGIEGWFYQIIKGNTHIPPLQPAVTGATEQRELDNIKAQPCRCPHCGQDYERRTYTKSPIRNFRTGIKRSNQLLSKELMYQLDSDRPKLIGFSDSREDAAQQALGIEREHHRDMVRMLFIEHIEEYCSLMQELKSYLDIHKDDEQVLKDFSKNPGKFEVLPSIKDIIRDFRDEEPIDHYFNEFISLGDFLGNNTLDGLLVKKMVKLGLNPSGVASCHQYFGNNTSRYHWSEAFDFNTGSLKSNVIVNDNTNYISNALLNLQSEIYANSFGKYLSVSLQDAGAGYICCAHEDVNNLQGNKREAYYILQKMLPQGTDVYDFVDSFIRILGDNFRYDSAEYELSDWNSYNDFNRAVKAPIIRFAEIHRINADDLGNALYNFLHDFNISGNATKLQFNNLCFRMMAKDEVYYRCIKCGRIHLHRGIDICTNNTCMEELPKEPSGVVRDLHKNHFISYDLIKERRKAKRIHTEEITGQTDNMTERLLEFKDFIINSNDKNNFNDYKLGYERSKSIDMACVTTTMEVGVDIGSLQAIFQGNMPPTRYNYQQRVGRGGRRGQAFSAAVTFCRGRSHDIYYYHSATDEIIGSIPTDPNLSISPYQDEIGTYHLKSSLIRRMLVKYIFRDALWGLDQTSIDTSDTHGQFGYICDWDHNKKEIENWIQNGDNVDNIVDYFLLQFNNSDHDVTDDINHLKNWVKHQMINEIQQKINLASDTSMTLAEYLAQTGFLPMYGMPSDIRSFYHGLDRENKQLRQIDRNLELSITEFGPYATRTKDKGEYTVEGLTVPMSYISQSNNNNIYTISKENVDALHNSYLLCYKNCLGDTENEISNIESNTSNIDWEHLNNNEMRLVIPQAYRTKNIEKNLGKAVNNDKGSGFNISNIWANTSSQCTVSQNVCNAKITVYGIQLDSYGEVWHINSNSNMGFEGNYDTFKEPKPRAGQNIDHANFKFDSNGNELQKIAIGSKKVTEMVKLEVLNVPESIQLCMEHGDKAAISSAFYSAAFLLQRVLADMLDVQPDDIEISEFGIEADTGLPYICMNDALPNGAGLVSYLYKDNNLEKTIRRIINFETSFMKHILNHEHRDYCLTACQKCILSYSNQGYHHVLDWRLGVGLLRLMVDSQYDFGITNQKREYHELEDQESLYHFAATKLGINYSAKHYVFSQQRMGEPEYKLIVHPLMCSEYLKRNIKSFITDYKENSDIHVYDLFRLLRSDLSPRVNNLGLIRHEDVPQNRDNIVLI